jgi:diacylglycerol kinase family enzyme
VLVINGGDGTVQAALTELYHGSHFGPNPPPVAVLPNGKTNLIALDLGAAGDPIVALERVLELARTDLVPHIVSRELISLTHGALGGKPVLGMFLGGAGLADTMLFCRHKIYPLGLPNGFAHLLTALAALISLFLGIKAAFLPPKPVPVRVSVLKRGEHHGRFSLLMVTTLERLLLNSHLPRDSAAGGGALQLIMVERSPMALIRAMVAAVRGKLGGEKLAGVFFERGDEIRIEGDHSSVILDGELFEANVDRPIVLKPTAPVPFLRLAA